MKANVGLEVELHASSTSALNEGGRSLSQSGHFTPRKNCLYLLNRRFGEPLGPLLMIQR
jgi:hypothetical protein